MNPGLSLNPGTANNKGFQNYISRNSRKSHAFSHWPESTAAGNWKQQRPSLLLTDFSLPFLFSLLLLQALPSESELWQGKVEIGFGGTWQQLRSGGAHAAVGSVAVKGNATVQAQKEHPGRVTMSQGRARGWCLYWGIIPVTERHRLSFKHAHKDLLV